MAPIEKRVDSSAVWEVVKKGSRGQHQDHTKVSVADLAQENIVMLVRNGSGSPGVEILSKDIQIGKEFVEATYKVDLHVERDTTSPITITIIHCKDFSAAQLALRQHIARFESAIEKVIDITENRYGDTSLQTRHSVFFQHLRHFLRISSTADEPNLNTLNGIAYTFSQYLATNNTYPTDLPTLKPILEGDSSITVVQGQKFHVKLNNIETADDTRLCLFGKGGLVIQPTPATGSTTYEFFARSPGSLKIEMLLAHKQYLTPASVPLQVQVNTTVSQAG